MINIVLSVNKLDKYAICPTLGNYNSTLNLVPILGKSPGLDDGALMHRGLEIYYRDKIEKKGLTVSQIVELTRNYAAKELPSTTDEVETVCKDLSMYINHYNSDRESWVIEAVEEPFAKVLYESKDVTIVINGKIDLRVLSMNGKGPRILVDHKYEKRFYPKVDRTNQALTYSWAYETKDWIFNLIGKQESYTPEKRLSRVYFNYSSHQIEEWIENTIDLAFEIHKYELENKFPRRYSGCNLFNKKCYYYDVCNTTPDNREYKLRTQFITKVSTGKTVMDNDESNT